MSFLVRILRRADQEVQDILHFISEERKAPEGARAWYRAYEAALYRLAEAGNTLPLAAENEFVDYEVRQILFKTRQEREGPTADFSRSSKTKSDCSTYEAPAKTC